LEPTEINPVKSERQFDGVNTNKNTFNQDISSLTAKQKILSWLSLGWHGRKKKMLIIAAVAFVVILAGGVLIWNYNTIKNNRLTEQISLEQKNTAIGELTKLGDSSYEMALTGKNAGKELTIQGKNTAYLDAARYYTQLNDLAGDNADLLVKIASIRYNLEDYYSAELYYKKALAKNNSNANILMFTADSIYEQLKSGLPAGQVDGDYAKANRPRFEEAINYFNQAISKDKNIPDAYYKSALLSSLIAETDEDKAKTQKILEDGLKIYPDSPVLKALYEKIPKQ